MTEVDEKNKVEWMEAFDCDVEKTLDQVTDDEQIRGKIRYLMLQAIEPHVKYVMRTKPVIDAAKTIVACDKDGMFTPNSDYAADRMGELYEAVAAYKK